MRAKMLKFLHLPHKWQSNMFLTHSIRASSLQTMIQTNATGSHQRSFLKTQDSMTKVNYLSVTEWILSQTKRNKLAEKSKKYLLSISCKLLEYTFDYVMLDLINTFIKGH